MKNLFRVFLCLILPAAIVMAQQAIEPKPKTSVMQPSGDVLVKALLVTDSAQNKKDQPSGEDLKKLLEREIAKSAALPLTTTQTLAAERLKYAETLTFSVKSGLVVIDGAVYLRFGDAIYPMVGGGASGCFDPDAEAKRQKARLKFAAQVKVEQEQSVQEKKD